jgi:cell volume regulation protein A
LLHYAVSALAIAAFVILVGRPVAVWLCLLPFHFSHREKLFISWVGLRGAVSIFLAAIPMLSGLPNAEVYFNIAFFVVLVSLVVQGWTLVWTAKRLGIALTQPAPEARRVEIDVPGQLEYEMVGYPILADSPVRKRHTLPSWVRPVFVVRNSQVLAPEDAGLFQPGDYGYFLASPSRVKRLDRLFAPRDANPNEKAPGIFLFKGDVPLSHVVSLYGLTAPDDLRELTIAEAFVERFENRLEVGDTIQLGPAALIARETDGELLISAALEIDDLDHQEPIAEARQSKGSDGRRAGLGILRRTAQ